MDFINNPKWFCTYRSKNFIIDWYYLKNEKMSLHCDLSKYFVALAIKKCIVLGKIYFCDWMLFKFYCIHNIPEPSVTSQTFLAVICYWIFVNSLLKSNKWFGIRRSMVSMCLFRNYFTRTKTVTPDVESRKKNTVLNNTGKWLKREINKLKEDVFNSSGNLLGWEAR